MIDTKALREKVLDLAICGKLVPQDPNDEPASVLLERIRAEKQQMVKDGKLKPKDIKNDTIIFKGEDNLHYEQFQDGTVKCIEDEIPFDVPDGWEWVRFGTLTINRDNERKPVSSLNRNNVEKKYDYYGASGKIDKINDYIFNEKLLLIGEDGANLITRTKPIAFFADGYYWVNNHAHCIDATNKNYLDYLCYYINAISLDEYITGSAQPKMNQENMNSIIISIPPLNEQLQIIKQIDNLFNVIDNLEYNIIVFEEHIELIKSCILSLAIRGKLVPQDPSDEPASVLLERIRAEKEELIKQGKIKRDKMESVIFKGEDNSYYEKYGDTITCIDSEIPFEIPDGWTWCRLQDVCIKDIKRGKAPKYSDLSNTIVFAQKCNTKTGLIDISKAKYLDDTTLKKYLPEDFLHYNDIIINSTGTGTLGRIGIFRKGDNTHNIKIVPDSHVTTVRVSSSNLNSLYVYYFLKYNQSHFEDSGVGSTNQKELKPETVSEFLIAIPPMDEQTAIIRKISELFSSFDCIEAPLK